MGNTDQIREEIRNFAELMEQTARRLNRIEIRTQARLDGFSAEKGIRPPLDVAAEDLPVDVDPEELAEFIGRDVVAEGQAMLAEFEGLQDQIRELACQAAPKPGEEVCYPIMFSADPEHPQHLTNEEVESLRNKFAAFGIDTRIIPPRDSVLSKLEAKVEEELVDQYISGWIAMSHLIELGKLEDEIEPVHYYGDTDSTVDDEDDDED